MYLVEEEEVVEEDKELHILLMDIVLYSLDLKDIIEDIIEDILVFALILLF